MSQCLGTLWGPGPSVGGPLCSAQGALGDPSRPHWGAQSGWGLRARGLEQFGQCQPSCYPTRVTLGSPQALWGAPPAHPALPPARLGPSPEVSYNFLIKALDIPAPPLSWDLGGPARGRGTPVGRDRFGGAAGAGLLQSPRAGPGGAAGVPAGLGGPGRVSGSPAEFWGSPAELPRAVFVDEALVVSAELLHVGQLLLLGVQVELAVGQTGGQG